MKSVRRVRLSALTGPFRFLRIPVRSLAAPVAASCLGSIAVLPSSLLLQRAVTAAEERRSGALLGLAAMALVVQIIGALMVFVSRRQLTGVFKRAVATRRAELLRANLDRPWTSRRGSDRSDAARTIMIELDRVDAHAEAVLGLFVPAVLLLAAGLAVVMQIQFMLGLLVIASSLPIVIAAALSSLQIRNRHAHYWTQHRVVSSVLDETIRADELFTDHGAQHHAVRRVKEPLQRLANAAAAQSNALSWSLQSQVITFAISSAIVLVYAADQLAQRRLTTSQLLVTLFSLAVAQNGARMIVFSLSPIISGRLALGSLGSLTLDEIKPTPTPAPSLLSGQPLTSIESIEVREVSFSYGDTPLLLNESAIVRRSETLVLRGENGAGKSTLLGILVGRIKPNNGVVLINGVAVEAPFPSAVLERIAVVGQESIVVRSTVEDNLRLLGSDASEGELLAALDTVGLRLTLHHRVGDDGELLSGGQRRRLAVARALLRHPDMLFLDEPANHLDESTVSLVERLTLHVPRMGLVIVTHDDSLDDLANATVVRLRGVGGTQVEVPWS